MEAAFLVMAVCGTNFWAWQKKILVLQKKILSRLEKMLVQLEIFSVPLLPEPPFRTGILAAVNVAKG